MSSIELFTTANVVSAAAEADGWTLRARGEDGFSLASREEWPRAVADAAGGQRVIAEVEQLLDMEIAEEGEGCVRIRWEKFGEVFADTFALPLKGSAPSPLMLRIDSISQVSRADFQYRYDYLLGARETDVERVGYFVRRRAMGGVYCLDERTFRIVDAMDRFNVLAADERRSPRSWLTLATVKSVASEVGATLDATLASNDVVVPSQLALGMCAHPDGSLSFYPVCDGLPEEGLKEAFFRNVGVEELYTLDDHDGRRVRVILDDRQQTVLKRMKGAQRLCGEARETAVRSPESFFDGVLDAITIYGERVIGVGDLPGPVMPPNPNPGGGFLVREVDSEGAGPVAPPNPDGWIELPVDGLDQLARLRDAVEAARREGKAAIDWDGRELRISPALMKAIERAIKKANSDGKPTAKGRMFLIVYTDEDELKEKDIAAVELAGALGGGSPAVDLPAAIKNASALKQHQREALTWLHRCSNMKPHRRGALLADEMGLGKTIEVLAFLAKHIESGGLRVGDHSAEGENRYRPILIVVPLMLLENETWQNEMKRFFSNDGDVFLPLLSLHGTGIERVRAVGAHGAETVIGRPVLDKDRLMQHRVVITNYETVVNYQHSLAQLFDGKRSIWSVVVTDEAQKQKAPDTKVSAALKAIAADFKIAMTGTPVENRLLDLWNIVDYFQPALLGTKRQFCSDFEEPAVGPGAGDALDALRERLLYRKPHAYLLRRTTEAIVRDLPSRTVVPVYCDLSDAERDAHQSLLSVLGRERKGGAHLRVLQRLVRLYQHPALDHAQSERDDAGALLAQSSKLRAVVDVLARIKEKGEKAILFARYIDAQQILSLVISETCGIPVPIINGATSRAEGSLSTTAGTNRAKQSRKAILDEFRDTPGFGVVVLSPFVAGIGLTIVEANHVIHYGRWWNPAVEAQATARVYRLGQSRPVQVYLPILVDPKKVIAKTFDERLHELMQRKEALARDFLCPPAQEDECATELCDDLLREGAEVQTQERPFEPGDLAALEPGDFEAAVGALLAAEGHRVVLTARSNDGGADVIALLGGCALLVQAKHTAVGTALDDAPLNDLLGAADIYRPRLGINNLRLVVASNAPPSPVLKGAAAVHGIELLCGERLVKRMKRERIGLGAMVACAATRCKSFEEGVKRARAEDQVPR